MQLPTPPLRCHPLTTAARVRVRVRARKEGWQSGGGVAIGLDATNLVTAAGEPYCCALVSSCVVRVRARPLSFIRYTPLVSRRDGGGNRKPQRGREYDDCALPPASVRSQRMRLFLCRPNITRRGHPTPLITAPGATRSRSTCPACRLRPSRTHDSSSAEWAFYNILTIILFFYSNLTPPESRRPLPHSRRNIVTTTRLKN